MGTPIRLNLIRLTLAVALCLGVVVALPTTSASAVESGRVFSGSVTTAWAFSDISAGREIEYTGSVSYRNLEHLGGDIYAADIELSSTVDDHIFPPTECTTISTAEFTGNYGKGEYQSGALTLEDTEEGVLFGPHLLTMDFDYVRDCGDGGTASTTTAGFTAGETWTAPLSNDTDPAADRVVGTMEWTESNPPDGYLGIGGGDSLADYAFTVTYDLTLETTECAGPMYQNHDAFRAHPDMGDPWMHFEVSTEWCELDNGEVRVFNVQPQLADVDGMGGVEYLFVGAARFFLAYGDEWREPTYTVSGNKVVATGVVETCLGIPILGKFKHVFRTIPKLPDKLRYLKQVLNAVDGRWAPVAHKLAKLAGGAAKTIEWALENGGRAAKWAARTAWRAFDSFISALPDKAQRRLLDVLIAQVADYSVTRPAAKWFLKQLGWNKTVDVVGSVSAVLVRFLETEVCWKTWRPRIKQTLVAPGGENGVFVDLTGDVPWRVERHQGAF